MHNAPSTANGEAAPSFDDRIFEMESSICHLAREARAAQIMADELLQQIAAHAKAGASGAQMFVLTAEARELVSDFSARVASLAGELRADYYEVAK